MQYYVLAKRTRQFDKRLYTRDSKILSWGLSLGLKNMVVVDHETVPLDVAVEVALDVPLEPATKLCLTKLCLILHCEKYAHRREKYVSVFRPLLESLGFQCVLVMGNSATNPANGPNYTETTLVNDILHVPVQEGYTRCHLKMYHAYAWAKTQSPTLLLKIDDDISILNEEVFRQEYIQAVSYDYTAIRLISCGNGMSHIYKKDDPEYQKPYKIRASTYGVGGMHFLSGTALSQITQDDMTQTIFEDLNMGLLAKKYRWRIHDLRWIDRNITNFERQET
jgi:hypothetical protein